MSGVDRYRIGRRPIEGVEIVFVSDVHAGRRTPSFNSEVLSRRITRLYDEVRVARRIVNRSRISLVKRVIVFLGDIVDGEGVYRSQPYEQELNIDEQIEFIVSEFKPFFMDADTVVCVPGNHGRARRDGTGNWDLMLYYILRERYRGKEFFISRRGKYKIDIAGVRWYLTHGDQIRMYQQIPFYGITRDVMREYMLGGFDAVALAHFHVFFKYNYNGIPIYGNGTMLTDDELGVRLGLKSSCSFWYVVIGGGEILFDRELRFDGG